MHTWSSGIRWWFENLDNARRQRGVAMDRMGYGPVETSFTTVLSAPGMHLRRYGDSAPDGDIALIVPAPIKRHYIWDLAPDCSVVQRLLKAGMQVYLIEWTNPTDAENGFGLAEYANTMIGRCIDAIRAAHHPGKLFLLSHSLGGVLATIYAALHADRVDGLVLVEAPLHFAKASGSFTPILAFGPPARSVSRMFGRVPGSVLSLTSVAASPTTFQFERNADFLASLGSPKNLKTHLLVERWTLDEAPMSGKLFEQVVDQLYREDNFMLGSLWIDGKRIGPRQVTAPLLAVYDPRSVVIPPDSIITFHDAARSRNKRLLAYQGDTGVALAHVGSLVGENAHENIWPEILRWIESVAATRH